ncbi:MAG TPA: alpha/beta hydrolase [Firmicutes bacterium]|jgi:pimeloyl-ACP methyl ester carboxylesterase|nr:alpha/beta hydrolase [Bacillota bacterium]
MNIVILISAVIVLGSAFLLPVILNSEHAGLTPAVREKAPGKFIHLSQGYTHYEIAGPENGSVIILIHGFSVPYYMWDQNFTVLSKAGFRVVRYDLYGRGLSDRPDVTYDCELFVTQLRELIDALKLKGSIQLIGNSMGGAVATAFAAKFPEQIGKLALIDPFNEQLPIGPFKMPLIGEFLSSIFLVPTAPQRQLQDFCHPERFPEWPKLFRQQMQYKGFGRALLSTLRNFISQDPSSDYFKIARQNKSVMLIWGTEDRTLSTKGAVKLYHILHPELVWVEQAGHLPHYELPEIVNPQLIEFLAEHNHQEISQREQA